MPLICQAIRQKKRKAPTLQQVGVVFENQLQRNSHHHTSSTDPKSLAHDLVTVPADLLHRAGFDQIQTHSYQGLRSRLVVATEVVQGHSVTHQDFETLDNAVVTGRGFNTIIKGYLGVDPTNVYDPNDAGLLGSLYSTARAWGVSGPSYGDEGEMRVNDLLRRASRIADPAILGMISTHDWTSRMPRATQALFEQATTWILDKVESASNTWAHRASDEQFRAGEAKYRAKVEKTFGGMVGERMEKLKAEVNEAETKESPGYVPASIRR